MRVRVSVSHIFFTFFNARAYVRACVCVCFFILYFFTMVCILFRINFQIHLISHILRLAGSVSIGAVVGFRPLAHVLPLLRSTRSTDKTCSTYFKVVQLDPLSFNR